MRSCSTSASSSWVELRLHLRHRLTTQARWLGSLLGVMFLYLTTANAQDLSRKPNIVVILADDLGYGDVKCYNATGKIPTPHIDRLAQRGVRFTDAHAPSAVCTPTRYALLTGQYCWRTRLKANVLWDWEPPLIAADRPTIATLLKRNGYRTAAIGKWHLGLEWAFANAAAAKKLGDVKNKSNAALDDIDWTKRIGGGPTERGFDYYFGVNAPNFCPYAFIENDRLVGKPPNAIWKTVSGRVSQNGGPGQDDFDLRNVAPTMSKKACEWIKSTAKAGEPFFLYLALTGPHSPHVPTDEFKGKSGIGTYGDFVMQMDATVGDVVEALREAGVTDDTLVIVTSDNGPEAWNYEEARDFRHFSMGSLRGVKRDSWEGGHRVPFVAAWPGKIKPGSTSDEVICHVDMMATLAAILGVKVPANAGEDSCNVLPALLGQKLVAPIREATVHHSAKGDLAIRQGPWLFIDAKTGENSKEPEWFKKERGYSAHKFPGELYRLDRDLQQKNNLYGQEPEVVERLRTLLDRYRREGRSVPR